MIALVLASFSVRNPRVCVQTISISSISSRFLASKISFWRSVLLRVFLNPQYIPFSIRWSVLLNPLFYLNGKRTHLDFTCFNSIFGAKSPNRPLTSQSTSCDSRIKISSCHSNESLCQSGEGGVPGSSSRGGGGGLVVVAGLRKWTASAATAHAGPGRCWAAAIPNEDLRHGRRPLHRSDCVVGCRQQ